MKPNTRTLTVGLLAALPSILAKCTRGTLSDGVDAYLDAQQGDGIGDLPITTNISYTENRIKTSLNSSIVTKNLDLDWDKTLYDTTTCATWTEMISADPKQPYVIGMRLQFDKNGEKITKMDSIVTTTGDWLFNATATLNYFEQERWNRIPEAKRDNRTTLQSAADTYANLFSDVNSKPPFGTPCCRIEGGASTCASANSTNLNTCVLGIPDASKSPVYLVNREYVIDTTEGIVQVLMDFGTMADSHQFMMRQGKIRYVHTMTAVCPAKNCTTSTKSADAPVLKRFPPRVRSRRSVNLWEV